MVTSQNGWLFFQIFFVHFFFKTKKNKQTKIIIIYLTNMAPSGLKHP